MSPGYLPSEVQCVTMLRVSAEVWMTVASTRCFLHVHKCQEVSFLSFTNSLYSQDTRSSSENSGVLSWWYILKRSSLLLIWTSSFSTSFVNGFHSSPAVIHPWMPELDGKVFSITGGHWESLSMSIKRHECIEKDMRIISVCNITFISLISYLW